MRAVVQRLGKAEVEVNGNVVGRTRTDRPGLLVLLGVGQGDSESDSNYLVEKIAGLRIFPDQDGKMNLSVKDVQGTVLVVSQFTLYGDCRKGRRPSFISAMEPIEAERMVRTFCLNLRHLVDEVEEGVFGADMQVTLTNDGPVTLLIDSKKQF
jgi:D-tyrosyl-tRNA(Tyr) deacylase